MLTLKLKYFDTLFYSDEVTFRYTPYGDINKTVHFVLDGKEIAGVETTASGRQMTYTLAKQSHGAHLLKVYMTASINNQDVTSESVYKDIVWVEQGNTTPIIGLTWLNLLQNSTIQQASNMLYMIQNIILLL